MAGTMGEGILSPDINEKDASISQASIDLLRPYLLGDDRSLVFFVGAGASAAGNTGMPSTPALLQQLLLDALKRSGKFDTEDVGIADAIEKASKRIGFEITLNDFWQICRDATTRLYASFAAFDESCMPNRVHTFLAYWLSTGGIALTTNYDRLIEREWLKTNQSITVRYQEEGIESFANWREDLNRGGCLFKIHGSLDDPGSCLGALEHVGTRLAGRRADLLAEIVRHRPLCFVGWQGSDPDIPPLLSELYKTRNSALPVFWVHYEGKKPDFTSIERAIGKKSAVIRDYASEHPILVDADRAADKVLHWLKIKVAPNPAIKGMYPDFTRAVGVCSASSVTRFVGIALRRAGQLGMAEQVLKVAQDLARTGEERTAALQEESLSRQQRFGKRTDESRKLLEKTREAFGGIPDLRAQLNTDFGLFSMTIVTLQSRPWLILKVPGLYRRYKQDIDLFRRDGGDPKSVALHESLLHLYLGRLRFKLFGWLTGVVPPLADWILQPFDIARSTIGEAKDIHLHSRIDVLAYRAVALARLRRCLKAMEDVPEIDRLVPILKDYAREKHWKGQRREIERQCGDAGHPRKLSTFRSKRSHH